MFLVVVVVEHDDGMDSDGMVVGRSAGQFTADRLRMLGNR